MTFSPNTPGSLLLAPFSQEAEEAVIGSVLISPTVFKALDFLSSEDFYLTRHRHIWDIFLRLNARKEIMDLTTVSEELRQVGVLDEIGSYAYLIQLINNTPNSMHSEAYGRLVERTATRRKLLIAADKIRESAMDESKNIEQVGVDAEGAVKDALRSKSSLTPVITFSDAIDRFKESLVVDIQRHQENPDYVVGIRTGLEDLDKLTDGLPVGVTVFAGPTGVGKTAFVCSTALNASQFGILHGKESRPAKTLLFSGEMTERQLMDRFVSNRTAINSRRIRRGNLSKDEILLIASTCDRMKQFHKLSFESAKRLNTAQIRRRVRELVMYGELDLLILDGLMQIDPKELEAMSERKRAYFEAKRRDAMGEIMNDLEETSIENEVAVLITHQLNRAASQGGGEPELYHLAEAIFVEQKVALALLFYRESYYKTPAECERHPKLGKIFAKKARFGEVGNVWTWCDLPHMKITDADVKFWKLTKESGEW